MRLTVNKYLNARIGEPSTNVLCQFYKSPGDILEIDDVVVGTEIDGNSIWYHCKDDGCYYWSGGINEVNFQIKDIKALDDLSQIKILKSVLNAKEIEWKQTIINYLGSGVGFNYNLPRIKTIIIYVSKKSKDYTCPKEIFFNGLNIPIEITEVEKIKHHDYEKPNPQNIPCSDLDSDSPYQLGGTIAVHEKGGYGSRSLRLYKNGNYFAMTCFHVLFNDLKASNKFDYIAGVNNEHRLADLPAKDNKAGRKPNPFPVIEGHYNSTMDFALVQIDSNILINEFLSQQINGFYTSEMIDSLLDKTVKLIGSTSFRQAGKIKSINTPISVDDNEWPFRNAIIAERISDDGDSGAPVIDENNMLVGYIIAGNKKDQTVILPYHTIFSNYGYTIEKPEK